MVIERRLVEDYQQSLIDTVKKNYIEQNIMTQAQTAGKKINRKNKKIKKPQFWRGK